MSDLARVHIPRHEEIPPRNQPHDTLTDEQKEGERYDSGRIVVFTDGSSIQIEYRTLQRAGWGAFFGNKHPWNAKGPVNTRSQTSYRGELRALMHIMATASIPTQIVTDCMTLVGQAGEMIKAREEDTEAQIPGSEKDLWTIIRQQINERPKQFFDIRWTPAHLEGEDAEEAIQSGKTSPDDIARNAKVDILAGEGAESRQIHADQRQLLKEKAAITTIIQKMLVSQWTKLLDQNGHISAQMEDTHGETSPNNTTEHTKVGPAKPGVDDGGADSESIPYRAGLLRVSHPIEYPWQNNESETYDVTCPPPTSGRKYRKGTAPKCTPPRNGEPEPPLP